VVKFIFAFCFFFRLVQWHSGLQFRVRLLPKPRCGGAVSFWNLSYFPNSFIIKEGECVTG
jgi:hypothetical protein